MIKIAVKERVVQGPVEHFPLLIRSREYGTIVYATGRTVDHYKGAVIDGGDSSNPNGYFSRTWVASCFEPFTGEITLSNE